MPKNLTTTATTGFVEIVRKNEEIIRRIRQALSGQVLIERELALCTAHLMNGGPVLSAGPRSPTDYVGEDASDWLHPQTNEAVCDTRASRRVLVLPVQDAINDGAMHSWD